MKLVIESELIVVYNDYKNCDQISERNNDALSTLGKVRLEGK
jgi:hypothetical protein